jgi:hypothetical protein
VKKVDELAWSDILFFGIWFREHTVRKILQFTWLTGEGVLDCA